MDTTVAETTSRRGPSLRSAILLSTSFVLLAAIPGCRGCIPDPQAVREQKEKEAAEEEKKKKKPKDPFESGRIVALPDDETMPRNGVKPGHWMAAVQRMKANNEDFIGQLHADYVDSQSRVIRLQQSPYSSQFTRRATLPKGQTKHFELLYFVPRDGERPMLRTQLATRAGGRPVQEVAEPVTRLEPQQYLIAVLSNLPDSYGYLKKLPTVAPPRDEMQWMAPETDYIVLLPAASKRCPLPTNPLTWTSIAFVVWDDYDPDLLTAAQRKALIDWIHWGGQLIISGPRNLERLKGTFLADYLPARAGKAVMVSRQLLNQLDEHWYIKEEESATRPQASSSQPPAPAGRMPEIVALQPDASADYVPRTGRLLVERRIGRGRIVASAFSLADRQFVNRTRFDELFNACILRRGPRVFHFDGSSMTLAWEDDKGAAKAPPVARQATRPNGPFEDFATRPNARFYEPRRFCALRFFSRDAQQFGIGEDVDGDKPISALPEGGLFDTLGYRSDSQSGVAGWSDFSGVANAARASLDQAAGISVPSATFVFQILAVYLLFLVPINWGFFKLIGRVEWAWAAAPVIALVGAVVVVRMAQLDIGFVRNRTEIAVLETQANHPRAHVTRFSGLYTSLSTRYDLDFEGDTALALPFSTDPSGERLHLQRRETVTFRRDKNNQLSGFRVMSNATGMVHSEQMHTLDGPIYLSEIGKQSLSVINNTEFKLRGVGVVRRGDKGDVEIAVVGRLDSKQSSLLRFRGMAGSSELRRLWDENLTTAATSPEGDVGLRPILETAVDARRLNNGDVRLVGWTDQEVPGLTIRPKASQDTLRTIVVANLRYGPLPLTRGDAETDSPGQTNSGKYPEIRAMYDRRRRSEQAESRQMGESDGSDNFPGAEGQETIPETPGTPPR